jgi:serine/threonine protein kinase
MTIEFLEGPQSFNQYQDIKYFRKGGMGEIYLADDVINKNKVAIKIIPIDLDADIQLLKQEFDIALKLKNENVIETYYSNRFQIGSEEYFYSSMEYVESGNFRDILKKQQGHFDLSEAANFMLQIANGLSYAHKYAIHRDLKPENILNKSGKLLICDFGLSKYIDSKTRSHTLKGSGTLPYMAPETWTYDTNSVAMDLYSLGILFFEILTLEQPFVGPAESDFKSQHLFQNLPSIRNYRKDLPLRIEEMINKLTSKRVSDRYKDVSDVIAILNSLNLSNNSFEGKAPINILLKAQKKISDLNQERLEIEKLKEMESERKDYLNYSTNILFEKYINRISQLNEEMEREKIQVHKSTNQLNIRFLDKSASISFYAQNLISQFLEESRTSFFDFQNKKYGFIMQEYKKKVSRN